MFCASVHSNLNHLTSNIKTKTNIYYKRMGSNRIFDFNAICRICLGYELELKSLYQSEAAAMLTFCHFLEIYENDNLPTHICMDCDKTLQDSYNFKQKCITSHQTLQKFLESVTDSEQINSDREIDLNIIGTETDLHTIYSCPKCNSTFLNEPSLQEHMLKGNIENCSLKLQCNSLELDELNDNEKESDSNNKYNRNTNNELTSFLEGNSTSYPHKCTQCIQSFSEESDLDLHMSIHTTGDLICKVCNKLLRNRQLLKRHIKTHMMHKPYVCQKCGKGYAESHSLTKHMRTHMGIPREKKHFCDDCGQGFSEPYYLKVHKRKHTGERPLTCEICDKSFADPRSLKVHNMMHSGEKPYKCHFCPKGFSQSVNLTKHIRVHTGEKPYVCTICNKRFTQSSSLDKHHRIHTGEKPFACNRCSKSFAEKGTLIHHIRTHTGEKPYICKVCGKSFASSSELKLHDRKHSGIKKNICNVCGKDFATPNNLLVHTRSHTGEKPFECTSCGRKFADKSTLNKHSTLMHT